MFFFLTEEATASDKIDLKSNRSSYIWSDTTKYLGPTKKKTTFYHTVTGVKCYWYIMQKNNKGYKF